MVPLMATTLGCSSSCRAGTGSAGAERVGLERVCNMGNSYPGNGACAAGDARRTRRNGLLKGKLSLASETPKHMIGVKKRRYTKVGYSIVKVSPFLRIAHGVRGEKSSKGGRSGCASPRQCGEPAANRSCPMGAA